MNSAALAALRHTGRYRKPGIFRSPPFASCFARYITTTYFYDELNRVTLRDYSDTTPDVSYVYDPLITNGKGRLASVTSSVSGYNYTAFDAMGRVTQYNQQTASQLYLMGASYNKGGLMMTESYPSGKVIETQYDGAGRIAGVKKQSLSTYIAGAASSDAVNRLQYTASGAVRAMKLGNGLWEHTNFNSRLQPTQIGLGTTSTTSERLQLDYGYGASASVNNGNITSQQITAPGFSVTQSYIYDQVNRLASATETNTGGQTWQQVYDYDVYGNRAVRNGSYIPTPALTPTSNSPADLPNLFFQTNNRIKVSGFSYDLVGNLTKDPTTAANAMVYDAENRQVSYTKASVTTSYTYDGDGRRVRKVTGSETTVFVYNAAGQLIAEYVENGGGGSMQTSYLTSDHLGSTRVVTDGAGAVKARHDYLPFGEEIESSIGGRSGVTGYAAVDSTRQRFTGQQRDTESGLDYFLARYYSGAQGRFTSVDPSSKSMDNDNPQKWNRYSYVLGNPFLYIDQNGKWPTRTHRELIRKAFPGLSKREIKAIQKGSRDTDAIKGILPITLLPSQAHKHAMRQKGETVEQADRKALDWLDDRREAAKEQQSLFAKDGYKGLYTVALYIFGEGAHTIMDNTSPAHSPYQEFSVPDPELPDAHLAAKWGEWFGGIFEHSAGESRPPTKEEEEQAINDMRHYFGTIFGEEALKRAITPPPPPPPPKQKND